MGISFRNLDSLSSFAALSRLAPYNFENFSPQRVQNYDIAMRHYRYNFAAKAVDDTILSRLYELAEEQDLLEKFRYTAEGGIVNTGEQRMVLHHATRGTLRGEVVRDKKNYHSFYREQRERIRAFAAAVHDKTIVGTTGASFTTFVQIGIGGSDLGPRALVLSLREYAEKAGKTHGTARFVSNVDPDDASAVLATCDPERTLFILVSKSGTTQETLSNEAFALRWLEQSHIPHPRKHMVAVTSETSPMARSGEYLDSFFIDDYIGGRYSSSSAVGVCIMDLALDPDITDEFLLGAHEADVEALHTDIPKNAAAIDALIGVFERNVMNLPSTAVLPYSQALSRFPAHLQQLDMESNGKHVNRDGNPISYATGPLLFGEPGTNGQHSFYQLLHQGTDVIPLQFIGYAHSQRSEDVSFKGSTNQRKLLANLCAQIVAFALGKRDAPSHKVCEGRRPSSMLYSQSLSPKTLGALLSHFENKVMFQGFLWNINSFDQEGVQLGKLLTDSLLSGNASAELRAYTRLFETL